MSKRNGIMSNAMAIADKTHIISIHLHLIQRKIIVPTFTVAIPDNLPEKVFRFLRPYRKTDIRKLDKYT